MSSRSATTTVRLPLACSTRSWAKSLGLSLFRNPASHLPQYVLEIPLGERITAVRLRSIGYGFHRSLLLLQLVPEFDTLLFQILPFQQVHHLPDWGDDSYVAGMYHPKIAV